MSIFSLKTQQWRINGPYQIFFVTNFFYGILSPMSSIDSIPNLV